jgi:Probable sensor domain DACNG
MNEIRLFVSGYQRHFWISARHATEALFRALDKELHVELFLVGILREDTADRHTVCLEPEDCGFDPAQFSARRSATGITTRSSAILIIANNPAAVAGKPRQSGWLRTPGLAITPFAPPCRFEDFTCPARTYDGFNPLLFSKQKRGSFLWTFASAIW